MVLFMRPMRKKTWRRYSGGKPCAHVIRAVCCCALMLELAFLAREMFDGEWYRTDCVLETAAGDEAEKTYGIRVRLQDGEIDFYKKEKLKSTN